MVTGTGKMGNMGINVGTLLFHSGRSNDNGTVARGPNLSWHYYNFDWYLGLNWGKLGVAGVVCQLL